MPPPRRWKRSVAGAHGRSAGDAAGQPLLQPRTAVAQRLALIEAARAQVAALVGAQPAEDIVFTSGATEVEQPRHRRHRARCAGARRQAACGHAGHRAQVRAGDRVKALATEGGAVDGAESPMPKACCRPGGAGRGAPARHLPGVAAACEQRDRRGAGYGRSSPRSAPRSGVPLHIDTAQSAGKLPLTVDGLAMLSLSAHKLCGPQGIGALWVAPAHRGRDWHR